MDDDFLSSLNDRVNRAVPTVPVHTERVIPRARRRRRVTRAAQTVGVVAVLGVVAGGVGWAWQDQPRPVATQPPTVSPSPTPSPTPTDSPLPEPSTEAPAAPVETPDSSASAPTEVTDALPYWHLRTETRADGVTSVSDTWVAMDQPSMSTVDDDLGTAQPMQTARQTLDSMMGVIAWDGQFPEDAATLRTMLEEDASAYALNPDALESTVLLHALAILREGGVLPASLRQAAWELLTASDGVTVTPATDALGRSGQMVVLDADDGSSRYSIVDVTHYQVLQSRWDDLSIDILTGEAVAGPPITPPAIDPQAPYGE